MRALRLAGVSVLSLTACFGRTAPEALVCSGAAVPRGGRCVPVVGPGPASPRDAAVADGAMLFDLGFSDFGPRRDLGTLDLGSDAGVVIDADVQDGGGFMRVPVIVDPTSIDFGLTRVQSRQVAAVFVRNPLMASRTVSLSVRPSGAGVDLTRSTFALGPGAVERTEVVYEPRSPETLMAELQVESCGGLCPITVPLRGRSVVPGYRCSALSVGPLEAGSCRNSRITCDNLVDQQIIFEPGSASGEAVRRIVSDRFVVPARSAFQVEVEACAPRVGDFTSVVSGTLTYPGALGAPFSAVVQTEGVDARPPACRLAVPQSVDFGTSRVSQFVLRSVLLRNTGQRTCNLSRIRVSGPQASDFGISGVGSTASIPAGGSLGVSVRFEPSAVGTRAGSLELDVNDPTQSSVQVMLQGRGSSASGATRFDIIQSNGGQPSLPTGRTLAFTNRDDGFVQEPLPFSFDFLGTAVSQLYISTNGFITFSPQSAAAVRNRAVPATNNPNSLIAWFWDDLILETGSSVQLSLQGSAPNRRLILSYRGIQKFGGGGVPNGDTQLEAQVELHETTNEIVVHYGRAFSPTAASAFDATLGWENASGTAGGSPLTCGDRCALSDWPSRLRIRYVPR